MGLVLDLAERRRKQIEVEADALSFKPDIINQFTGEGNPNLPLAPFKQITIFQINNTIQFFLRQWNTIIVFFSD